MNFRISDTFTDSLAKLTGEEQKAAKTTAFDLQLNPANPGHQFHKLDKAKDKHFWSVRVSSDIRLIVHKTDGSLLLCYVAHHDDAYRWAERRKLETHPTTGAAQLVEVRETVQEILVPVYRELEAPITPKPRLFASRTETELLGYGVPPEWLADVLEADEDRLLVLADHLPAEAAEALLELATGGTPAAREVAIAGVDPLDHPDAQRRFRVMTDVEELERALASPWDKWTIFLHPQQRQWVEKDFNGPARVSGSAGTGKTIVALHRAVHLAQTNPNSRILLTTFSENLASLLRTKLRRLIGSEPSLGERLEVQALTAIGERLYEGQWGKPRLATEDQIRTLLARSSSEVADHKFSLGFLLSEWEDLVDAMGLDSWSAYRDVKRLGRKTRLPEPQRELCWRIFELLRDKLRMVDVITPSAMSRRLADHVAHRGMPPFEFVVVDEGQDISPAQLRFLAAMAGTRPNGLFFAGDLGQRIFQTPFSWLSQGVDVRGRSRTLRINYRTSHQIRHQADLLLGPEVTDVDGETEERKGHISVFNGPPPAMRSYSDEVAEHVAVGDWLKCLREEGVAEHEMAVIVRSESELDRARAAVHHAGLTGGDLDGSSDNRHGKVAVVTMHMAKGLEFKAVAVMACDDEIVPLRSRLEGVTDDSDLDEVYNTERHLLYVACTRARDHLLVTCVGAGSEFLDDMGSTVAG